MAARLCCVASCISGARAGLVTTSAPVRHWSVRRASVGIKGIPQACASVRGEADARDGELAQPGGPLEPDAPLSLWHPTPEDVRVVEERQLGNRVNMLGVGMRCRHGCPQAFAFDALERPGAVYRGPGSRPRTKPRSLPLEAGLFRLSCPLLVKAIDEWEAEGAVKQLNAQVAADESGFLPAALRAAHGKHSAARLALFGARLRERLRQAPPDDFAKTKRGAAALHHIISSGVAGQTQDKADVKCLHAQVADFLCRNGDNAIGALVLSGLTARGVDVRGDVHCNNQCSLAVDLDDARRGWWYEPVKNKWKLRQTARRRTLLQRGDPASSERRQETTAVG